MASLISSMVALTLSSAISSKSNALLIVLISGLQFINSFGLRHPPEQPFLGHTPRPFVAPPEIEGDVSRHLLPRGQGFQFKKPSRYSLHLQKST